MNTILVLAASSVLFVIHCAAHIEPHPSPALPQVLLLFILESLSLICRPPSFPALGSGKSTSIRGIYWTGRITCSKHSAHIYKTPLRDKW